MNMNEYKVEDLLFLNMEKKPVYVSNPETQGGLSVFEIEEKLTEEEKLAIIDNLRDGIGSYMLNLIKKWEEEKDGDQLKKDKHGDIKTVSFKAWINRNDPREVLSRISNYGRYWLFRKEYEKLSTICPQAGHRYDMAYTGKPIVHQWFHELCKELHLQEKKYFKEHDPKQVKLTKVKEYALHYSVYFGLEDIQDIAYNYKTDVSEQRLDQYITAYEELEKKVEELTLTLK